ncbi:MAG: HAMP domain-containing histidine kinase, partial [Coriobacteriia bacterium]|nr:HAMP domain-containing histidine kinase [Coriobacteriia bacterium]
MKLWQKIFLTTLTLVIVLVNSISLIILKSNHDLALQREQQTALTRHNYLRNEILNYVANTQLSERTITLSPEQMDTLFKEVFDSQSGNELIGASLYLEQSRIHSVNDPGFSIEETLLHEQDYSFTITRQDDRVFIFVVSSPEFNGQAYQLITFYDITSTYQLFDATFNRARVIGIFSALFISGVLLLMVQALLKPLRDLSNTTREISSGSLEKRVLVRGNDELAEVAFDFNSMADSIESNVTALEQLAESRKVFIGNLAHEMRTPLTSILGYADLLRVQREVSDLARIEYANIIVNETKRLQSLSGKLMELLSVGSMQLALEPIDLNELTTEMTLTLQPIFQARNMNLACHIPDYDCVVLADRELIQSLIFNLVDNAIKASTEGATVTIAAREIFRELSDDTDGQTELPGPVERRIVVGVIDDGIGIAADQIAQLTEPFFMLDKARTRRHGGAGLGLALCAEIAKAHQSELYIESE